MSPIPAKMKAVVAGTRDGKPCPVIHEIDVPRPGPEDVLIKVAATGLNRGDLMQVAGLYPPPPGAPQTLGLEASGTVVATGERVTQHKVGDAVCGLVAGGGYAEYCLVHEGSALPVPKGVSLVDAAALPEAHFTVWTNVVDRARLKPGETLLVHGGSSGIGTTAAGLRSLVVEAAARTGVAGHVAPLFHREQQNIGVAVVAESPQGLDVTTRGSLVPQLLARAAPVVHLTRGEGALQRLAVHPGHHQHGAVEPVLGHGRNQTRRIEPQTVRDRGGIGSGLR